jgi:HK97 family phage major capsid protein
MTEKELVDFLHAQDAELKQLLTKGAAGVKELNARVFEIEQLLSSHPGGAGTGASGRAGTSLGSVIVDSDGFKAFQRGAKSSGQIAIKNLLPEMKATILSGSWSAPPDYRPQMATPPQPALPVRSLMANLSTQSNLIEYPRETSFTNAANYQNPEGSDKPESAANYALVQLPVCTIAHWIPVSRQVIDDSEALRNYVDQRMVFMLEQKIEREILFGSGPPHLTGIATVASVATSSGSLTLADAIGSAIGQLAAIGVQPDGCVVNPQDWAAARMSKASTSGNYLLGDPMAEVRPSLWGLTVVLAASMPQGRFLCGAFKTSSAIYDRMQNTLELSREHSSFFTQNLVAILVESRLAVAVFSPESFVYGATTGGPVVGS